MRSIRSAPRPVWIYAVIALVVPLVVALAHHQTRVSAEAWVAVALLLLLAAAVLYGSRAGWWIATIFGAAVVVTTPFDQRVTWWAVLLNVVSLICLLVPVTRHYCGIGRDDQRQWCTDTRLSGVLALSGGSRVGRAAEAVERGLRPMRVRAASVLLAATRSR